MKKNPTPDTGNDETPPHGITRPSPADLARAYLVRSEMLTDDPADRSALATLTLVMDSLDLIVRCWLSGDGGTIDQVVEASGDLFGWRTCPSCHEATHPDEWDARGFCVGCRPCARCGETGRTLDEESTCADCLGLYPEEMGEDDQDRDAYGAPYGGRGDLIQEPTDVLDALYDLAEWLGGDDPEVPSFRDALVRWHHDDEPMRVRFGIVPQDYDGDTADLDGDLSVFYWLTRTEAACLLPGGDDQHDEWVVVDCVTPHPCRHGHRECAVLPGGLCWQGARHDLDDLGNPFGGALDR